MSIKRCFLVLGPEGSGTYMMAEALVKCACKYVDEEENFKQVLAKCRDDNVVIRRSLPHRGRWPMIHHLANLIISEPVCRDLTILAMIREPNATALSVERRSNTQYFSALQNQQYALRRIFELEAYFPIIPITYTAFVTSEDFRRWVFCDRLNLQYPSTYEFENRNLKYYE